MMIPLWLGSVLGMAAIGGVIVLLDLAAAARRRKKGQRAMWLDALRREAMRGMKEIPDPSVKPPSTGGIPIER